MSSQSRSKDRVLPRSTEVAVRSAGLVDHMKALYESIARRAHQLFEARGREQGHDLDDWFQAEREISTPLAVNIDKVGNHIVVAATLPGFSQEEIKVFAEPDRIVIDAASEHASEQQGGDSFHTYARTDRFLASIDVPNGADPASAKAMLRDGVLEVTINRLTEVGAFH